MTEKPSGPLRHLGADLSAGLVVFLVAVPLCLGIAQASGAPLLSGLIAGVIGGCVVAAISSSSLSVSGPAAGLAVIVANGIASLGFRTFLLSVVLGGALQIVMGVTRLGGIAHFFPSSVIKGMLAAIGVLIILKQLPHSVGYDHDYEGDESLFQPDGENTFSALMESPSAFTPAAILVSVLCVGVMIGWPKLQRSRFMKLIPSTLIAVIVGAIVMALTASRWPDSSSVEHMVNLPHFGSAADVWAALTFPDFSRLADPAVWRLGVTMALVASLETLLSLEAVDRLDPLRRISPPNRELVAQGVGNMLAGLIGGLPVTSVIVRSSANVQAGGQTRGAAITHGVLLLVGVLFLAPLLNSVPLAALAVVLIFVGIKLTSPAVWRQTWQGGPDQFVPFVVTVLAVVMSDLLTGTLIGLAVGIAVSIRKQQRNSITVETIDSRQVITFHKDMTFLHKAALKNILQAVPPRAHVVIDRTASDHVDDDVEELLQEFSEQAPTRGLQVEITRKPS